MASLEYNFYIKINGLSVQRNAEFVFEIYRICIPTGTAVHHCTFLFGYNDVQFFL